MDGFKVVGEDECLELMICNEKDFRTTYLVRYWTEYLHGENPNK